MTTIVQEIVHFKDEEYSGSICHCAGGYSQITIDIEQVTCKQCIKKMKRKGIINEN